LSKSAAALEQSWKKNLDIAQKRALWSVNCALKKSKTLYYSRREPRTVHNTVTVLICPDTFANCTVHRPRKLLL
jgi:hypothetical protein